MEVDQLYNSFKESTGVSIDTRSLVEGQIFFAIQGDKFDGHDYVDKALEAGACLVVVQKKSCMRDTRTLLVEDTIQSLQALARTYRQSFEVPVIGLTGSNGKTTTKELLTAVLSQKYKVHATRGNLNNHLGVPLSILAADSSSEILVIEMGANHVGEIEFLCGIAQPSHGLITNIGYAHIEGFGSFEGIIQGKTELYNHLRHNSGTIFYNPLDDILVDNLLEGDNRIKYSSDLEFSLSDLSLELRRNKDEAFLSTKLYGEYNATNLQAAWTLGKFFEVEEQDILTALTEYSPTMNRSEIREVGTMTFIMDAYNANPTSMENSIKSFVNLDTKKKKVLILGDMKELGAEEKVYHTELLNLVQSYAWHRVYLVGKIFSSVGKDYPSVLCFDTTIDLEKNLNSNKAELQECICLLKASRSIGLEKIRMLTED